MFNKNMNMKTTIKISLLSLIVLSIIAVSAQTTDSTQKKKIVTEKFKVYGNCEQCKSRIEKATYKMKGVKDMNWDVDSKIFTVIYNSKKVSLTKIQEEILKSGHDLQDKKATDSSYKTLPDCCRYRR